MYLNNVQPDKNKFATFKNHYDLSMMRESFLFKNKTTLKDFLKFNQVAKEEEEDEGADGSPHTYTHTCNDAPGAVVLVLPLRG